MPLNMVFTALPAPDLGMALYDAKLATMRLNHVLVAEETKNLRGVRLDDGTYRIWEHVEPTPARNECRLDVDLQGDQAVLDGKPYALKGEQALFLKALLDAKGRWVSNREIGIKRPERVRKRLPAALQEIITAEPGKGSRLTIFDLA